MVPECLSISALSYMTSIFLSFCPQVENCMYLKIINILFFIYDVHALSLANADRIISIPFYCIECRQACCIKISILICWTGGEQQLEMSWGICFITLAANNFHLSLFQSNHWWTLWVDFQIQYCPDFVSTRSFIKYGSRVGPLLHACANSRLWRMWEHRREPRSPWLAAQGPN